LEISVVVCLEISTSHPIGKLGVMSVPICSFLTLGIYLDWTLSMVVHDLAINTVASSS
jgi:hypothetical protein